ncbi:hypothetical protein CF319_g8715 [Tilletia indica]|nr:hypothetical protein CF319_g8715 [Tilletia indica]
MTGTIFTEWVQWFDKRMQQQNRKVMLLIDNASSHKAEVELQSTTIRFLPPNTTSVLQPLDQGIIRSFKAHYRKIYYTELLQRMETENREEAVKAWDILDAVLASVDAWTNGVTASTVANCFKHAHIKESTPANAQAMPTDAHAPVRVESPEPELPPREEDSDDSSATAVQSSSEPELQGRPQVERDLANVIAKLGYTNRMSIDFLLDHPQERQVETLPTEDEIVEAVLCKEDEETEEDIVDMGGWKPKTAVSDKAALEAVRALERWTLQQGSFDEAAAIRLRNALSLAKNTATKQIIQSARQKSITDFFKLQVASASSPRSRASDYVV